MDYSTYTIHRDKQTIEIEQLLQETKREIFMDIWSAAYFVIAVVAQLVGNNFLWAVWMVMFLLSIALKFYLMNRKLL